MTSIQQNKVFASLPRTARGKSIVLNGDPKGKNFLYCNGNQVYIREIEDTSKCDIYSEHVKDTTVAKYSPSGFYIASGDISGKVRVWDTVNPTHILKKEHPVIGGAIKDIDWSPDNTKICAVGEGMSGFGKVFSFDSGNTVGNIDGHSKFVNSISYKPTRPYRIVTGSEDFSAAFFEGPPFKFKCTLTEASNFVNCVRYAPNGEFFIIGGADYRLWIYDGKTGLLTGELGSPKAHKGGIYAISFSPDSKKLLSVSGDKTAKIWNIESKACETEFVMGKEVNDMQVGCLWQGDHIITVSVSGHINYLDPSNPSQHKKVIKGHKMPITALAVSEDGSRIFSGGSDGIMVNWDTSSSDNDDFKGTGHKNQVSDLVVDGEYLISVGMDDKIMFSKTESMEYGATLELGSQPQALDSKNGTTVVVCAEHIEIFQIQEPEKQVQKHQKISSTSFNGAVSCSISPNGSEVAIGTRENGFIIYSLNNGTLTEKVKRLSGGVFAIAYSHDGEHLCASNEKNVLFFCTEKYEDQTGHYSSHHAAKVTSLSWSPNSKRLMSSSIDAKISLWEVADLSKSKPSVKAHPLSYVNKLRWLDNSKVVTAGQDSNLKIWNILE